MVWDVAVSCKEKAPLTSGDLVGTKSWERAKLPRVEERRRFHTQILSQPTQEKSFDSWLMCAPYSISRRAIETRNRVVCSYS